MSEEIILEILNDFYPKCVGAIWTGSSVAKINHNKSDIDILVIGAEFSVVSALVIIAQDLRFDFTQIPLTNIENILFDELYDPKGVLISMISNGRIIKDNESELLKHIQLRAISSSSDYQQVNEYEYERCISNLIKIKTQFDRPLPYNESFLLLNEFIYYISQAEVLRHSNWSHNGKHKPRFLSSKTPHFLSDLVEKAQFSKLTQENNDLSQVSSYIDFYLSQSFKLRNSQQVQDRIIIDVSYQDISLADLILNVLGSLHESPLLNKSYCYFYLSPKQTTRIYKKYACIVFNTDTNLTRQRIFILFKEHLTNKSKKNVSLSILPVCILDKQNPNKSFIYDFESVAKSISKICEEYVKIESAFNEERFFSIGLILLTYISKKLKMNTDDIIKCNYYLSLRHTFNYKEQRNVQRPIDFYTNRIRKYSLLKSYYSTHHKYFLALVEKGLSLDQIYSEKQKPVYYPVIESLTNFLKDKIANQKDYILQNQITLNVLEKNFNIKQSSEALLYILTFEVIVKSLNIGNSFVSLMLFSLTEQLTLMETKLR